MVLLRAPEVRAELNLAADQAQAIDLAIAAASAELWRVRDYPADKIGEPARQAADRFDEALRNGLRPAQRERLEQLTMRSQGWPAICSPAAVARLKLTGEQIGRIETVLRAHVEQAGGGDLDSARQSEILSVLTESQRRQIPRLLGKPFDLQRIRQQFVAAPELRDIAGWINGPPVRLADLRGKVVALHFFTHGCINCIHNYPTYQAWHRELPADHFVLLGVHTPEGEGEAERDPERIRAAATKAELLFPIAIDNQRSTWNDWGNHIWPAVYLIDKQGYVRSWWYGELKWEGAEGDRLLRTQTEQLIAE
jgi:peroxiredoxin